MSNKLTFSHSKIQEFIKLFREGDNSDFLIETIEKNNEQNRPFLKRDLVEAKVQIDRWGFVTTDWIFHTSQKEMIRKLFYEEPTQKFSYSDIRATLKVLVKYASVLERGTDYENLNTDNMSEKELDKLVDESNIAVPNQIWGARIHFTDDIAPYLGIGVSINNMVSQELDKLDDGRTNNSVVVFSVPTNEQKRD